MNYICKFHETCQNYRIELGCLIPRIHSLTPDKIPYCFKEIKDVKLEQNQPEDTSS